MIIVITLLEPFKNAGDCCAMNAYGIGNFIMALALPSAINNSGYFCWGCVDHDKECVFHEQKKVRQGSVWWKKEKLSGNACGQK